MYLVETDPKTGLVLYTGLHDGIMLIPEFNAVISDVSLGIEAFTCVALSIDWTTPIRNYIIEDRPKKAMYTITGKRDTFVWNQDKIQLCLKKYMELQFNPDLMERDKLADMRLKQLNKIDAEDNPVELSIMFKQLNLIKGLQSDWDKANEDKNLFSEAPVVNGYKLSRLEEKATDKRSFYHEQK